jgi:hypothetical protein
MMQGDPTALGSGYRRTVWFGDVMHEFLKPSVWIAAIIAHATVYLVSRYGVPLAKSFAWLVSRAAFATLTTLYLVLDCTHEYRWTPPRMYYVDYLQPWLLLRGVVRESRSHAFDRAVTNATEIALRSILRKLPFSGVSFCACAGLGDIPRIDFLLHALGTSAKRILGIEGARPRVPK